jgi:hypothetical protein
MSCDIILNRHPEIEDRHAIFGGSKYAWTNKTPEENANDIFKDDAAVLGTKLHDLARRHIELDIPMGRSQKTLNLYINHALKYGMVPEVALKASPYHFGKADALSFDKNGKLKIFDLKTGVRPASFRQLEIYAAFFIMEYAPMLGINPNDLDIELRIYQNDDVLIGTPSANDIRPIIDNITETLKIAGKTASSLRDINEN